MKQPPKDLTFSFTSNLFLELLTTEKENDHMNKDLTTGNPTAVLWRFCLPLFGSILFQQLYNIADSLVAGKFIGEGALAAVGNSY